MYITIPPILSAILTGSLILGNLAAAEQAGQPERPHPQQVRAFTLNFFSVPSVLHEASRAQSNSLTEVLGAWDRFVQGFFTSVLILGPHGSGIPDPANPCQSLARRSATAEYGSALSGRYCKPSIALDFQGW